MKLLALLCLSLSCLTASDQQIEQQAAASVATVERDDNAAQQEAAAATRTTQAAPRDLPTKPIWLNGSRETGFNLLLDLGNGLTLQSTTPINDAASRTFYRTALADPETMSKYMNGEHFTGDVLEAKINAHMGLHARTLQDGLPRFMIFKGDLCIGFVRMANADVSDFAKEPLRTTLAEKKIDLSNKGVGWPCMILLRDYWNHRVASTVKAAFMEKIIPFYAHNPAFLFTGHPLSHVFITGWSSNEHSMRLIISVPGMIDLGESEAHGVKKRTFLLALSDAAALGGEGAAANAGEFA